MKLKQSAITSLIGVFCFTALLTGCGKSDSGEGAKSGEKESTTSINIMTMFTTTEPPNEKNPILTEIEKKTNTKLNITWNPSSNYSDKEKVTLASGDIPELMLIMDPTAAQVRTMAKQGAFWDLTPYVKTYTNLSALPQESWKNSAIDGKNFGIPRVRALVGGGNFPMVRKDWLDKLGMKVPTTMDEMFEVLKAFTEQDPDGNGKKDTIGFSGYVTADSIGKFAWVEDVFNGTPGRWKLKDGKLVNTTLEPGTREALIWMNKAFAAGYISPDFPTLKLSQSRELMTTNKAGVYADAMNPTWLLTGQLRKTNPNADLLALISLEAGAGKYVPKESGYYGIYAIPKSVPEAKMKKILQFMDYGATEEGWILGNYGLKDLHYTEKDGIKTATDQAEKDVVANFGHIFSNLDKYQKGYQAGIPADFFDRNKKIIDERAKIAIVSPAEGLISETELKAGPDINKKIQDTKTKVIMGRETIKAWDDLVEKLKTDSEFQKIVAEMNEAYKQKK